WSATDSENTCSTCRELNGKVVGMDEEFAPGKLLPPLHPRCKCCVMYVNSKSMAAKYETEEDELREYSTEEIETHANKMSEIADKHLDLESSWSGKVVVDDDSGVYGIQWNGDIITRHETAPHILLHEQLHARSVTKYDHKMYKQYENMEEGSVQFAA
ncbi:phage head morphogenesis protein, partial [Anaerostipes hadrus]|uniref:phage minor head protein n=1 Tax=Anaerostipes hadrus TaxID=649756 RepID=UPI001D07249A